MKKFLAFWLLLGPLLVQGQVLRPYTLQVSLSKKEVKPGETVDVLVQVSPEEGWHVFSPDQDPDVGPIPATLSFRKSPDFQPTGRFLPLQKPIEKMDDIFGGKVRYFEQTATFKQSLTIRGPRPVIAGSFNGQVCQDDGVCIPVSSDFRFTDLTVLAGEAAPPTAAADTAQAAPAATTAAPLPDTAATLTPPATASPAAVAATPAGPAKGIGWGDVVLAFLAGLAAVAMPCVYPMMPMTVAMFTKRVGSRREGLTKALVYGLSIILIFAFFGTLVSALFGSAFVNFVSTHWLPNIFIFLVFVVFALSFLGAFEITLPSAFVNRVDAKADEGGYGGVFFMAFAQALVSFSCTAPIVGTAAILAANGSLKDSILLNLAFGTAFALPFVAAAFIPSMLKTLPKSGGWLNTLKVQLGFLELAVALKFLSVPDQTYHWGLLDRDVYLALWIVIFTMMGLNLLGWLRMSHDSPVESVSIPRMLFALAALSFAVYLVPGLFGAPLRPLSGLLPPETAQDFNLHAARLHGPATGAAATALPPGRRYADFLKLPHGLEGFFDYEEAKAYARQAGKPIFIDFTGHGCVNCRKMEETIWSRPEVLARLRDDFVIASLYVDDKTELPEERHFVSKTDGKPKTTIGDQNLDFEISKYNFNAQPLYVIVDPANDATPLVKPIAYTPDAAAFTRFLEAGKAAYRQ